MPLALPLHVGAAVALEGSASAPVPKLMGCPSNCAVCVAGVVEPSVPAMENRPVQVMLEAVQDENW